MTIVKFKGSNYVPMLRWYEDGNMAIELLTYRTLESNGIIATTNLGMKMPDNFVLIKDYSENEGMLKALVDAGIIKDIVGYEHSGFVTIPVAMLDISKLGIDEDSRRP